MNVYAEKEVFVQRQQQHKSLFFILQLKNVSKFCIITDWHTKNKWKTLNFGQVAGDEKSCCLCGHCHRIVSDLRTYKFPL